MKFIIATNNTGKVNDFKKILSALGHDAVSLKEAGIICDAEETGKTFAENAYIKAKAVFDIVKTPVIADDSGLSVDALGGEPGIYSARYGGEGLDDPARCRLLLKNMEKVPDDKRTASFICSLCCIINDDKIITAEGKVNGKIIYEPRGENGFGYDPLFYYEDYEKTFGEVPDELKNAVSHRANALKNLAEKLKNI